MKISFFFIFFLLGHTSFAQLEISSGWADNQLKTAGPVLHLSYEWRIKPRWYTKTQVGYKHLRLEEPSEDKITQGPPNSIRFLALGYTLTVQSWEIHQTLAFEAVHNDIYILKPNLGLNYRFFHVGLQVPPAHHPALAGTERMRTLAPGCSVSALSSTTAYGVDACNTRAFGISLQIQNQFRLNDKVWVHVTPFVEPTLDRNQNTGGFYVGIVLKQL